MKKTGVALALGLAGLLLMPSSLNCSMQNTRVSAAETPPKKSEPLDRKLESEVYAFAKELSRKMPEGFIREEFDNQFWYHDKKLKIEGGLPVEGSGRYVVTKENGDVSLGDWTTGRERLDIANVNSAFACYYSGDSFVIMFLKNPLVIQYVKSTSSWDVKSVSSWERQVDDIKDLKDTTNANPKEKTRVENNELSKYLELLGGIRKTYPAKAGVQAKPELPKRG